MYAPLPFLSEDPELALKLIENIVMGTLITSEQSLQGSPLPFMVRKKGSGLTLIGHMDKANPLWQTMQNKQQVMVVFWGPNTYISPSFYTTSPRVPTWLYATVHVQGIPTIIHDEQGLDTIVSDLSRFMEHPDSGWDISQVTDYKKRLLPAIVGFEIEVTLCQSQIRLAQVNTPEDQQAVFNTLLKGNYAQKQVAELMEQLEIIKSR